MKPNILIRLMVLSSLALAAFAFVGCSSDTPESAGGAAKPGAAPTGAAASAGGPVGTLQADKGPASGPASGPAQGLPTK